jgi:death on curing protein
LVAGSNPAGATTFLNLNQLVIKRVICFFLKNSGRCPLFVPPLFPSSGMSQRLAITALRFSGLLEQDFRLCKFKIWMFFDHSHSFYPKLELDMIELDEVKQIHEYLTEHYKDSDDPISPPGIKSSELLESAIARPFMTVAGKDAYPETMDKAAVLFHAIICNHTFHNGNKRAALLLTMCYLDEAGYWLDKCSDIDLYEFTRKTAAHEIAKDRKDEIKTIKAFLKKNSRKRKIEEQQLTYHALSQHLANAGFSLMDDGEFYAVLKNGKRYTKIIRKGMNGRENYDAPYVRSLRKKLSLTPTNGWDSLRFYQVSHGLTENIGELVKLRGAVLDWLAKI